MRHSGGYFTPDGTISYLTTKSYAGPVSWQPLPSFANEDSDCSVMLPDSQRTSQQTRSFRLAAKPKTVPDHLLIGKLARGRPPITWIHQICRDTGISVTDALQLAEDRSFWRQIATAECYGWTLRVLMMMMMMGHNPDYRVRVYERSHSFYLHCLQFKLIANVVESRLVQMVP